MIKKKVSINYINVLTHLLLILLFICFNYAEKEVFPYSVAVYVTAISLSSSPVITSVLFLLSFVLTGKIGLLASMSILSVFYCLLSFTYKKLKINGGYWYSALTIIGLLGYVFIGDTSSFTSLEKRLTVCFITALLSFLTLNAGIAVSKKGFKYKLFYDEYASIIIVLAVLGLGVCNFLTPYSWKGICAFLILICCYVFQMGIAGLISAVLGIGIAVYYGNLALISVFLIWGIICQSLMPVNRFLSAIALPVTDCAVQMIFSVYGGYFMKDFIPVIIGSIVFALIPTKHLKTLKDKMHFFKEKQLARQSINRNKIMTSNKLYELSGAFSEMANAFRTLKKKEMSKETAKNIIIKQSINTLCSNCEKKSNCFSDKKSQNESFSKTVEIGLAKGKLSLIDLPKKLSDCCTRPSDLLYSFNKLLADYRSYCLEKKNISTGRELLAMEADGVSKILKNVALDTGALLKYHSNLERLLSDNLCKAGYKVNELLVHGENEHLSVSVIISVQEYSLPAIQRIISKTMNSPMILCDKNNVTEEKIYMVFKKQAPYDAVFGIARKTKNGSELSGDTHSVTKISDNKFLVALCDGMGSGKDAENISSIALSLIESFYKSGLSGEIILSTVNKLLSINTEDSFTALDVSVIDLKSSQADFIKFGSPYGFIINENGIKIVEGNTLPLGIIEELKPSVCHTEIKEDSIILLVTDGVSDAFGSSGEIIDYIRSIPALNPQTLADSIVNRANELNNGTPQDDMTALAVRIFKKDGVA